MKRPLGFICICFILLIRLFYVCFPPKLPDYSGLDGRQVYIGGRIIDYKEQKINDKLQMIYTLDRVVLQRDISDTDYFHLSDKSNSKIYCYTSTKDKKLQIGSNVWLQGEFEAFLPGANPGQFDSQFYYHILGFSGSVKNAEFIWSDYKVQLLGQALHTFKQSLLKKADAFFGQEYTGVIQTLLLGEKDNLSRELKAVYKEGGILHILTISGLHISMLGMGSYRILRKTGIPAKAAAVAGLIIILLYGMMIGTQASTFRAVCMFSLQMGAVLCGRTYDRLTGLSAAAVLLLLDQPLYVFYAGFLMSFGCVLGVTLVTPALEKLWKTKKGPVNYMRKALSGGAGILLATFPIQLYFYYEYPLYSILINLLVLPFMPFVLGLGGGVLLLPEELGILGVPMARLCQVLLYGYEWLCKVSMELPGHSIVLGAPKLWQIGIYYIGLFVLYVGVTHSPKGKGRKRRLTSMVSLGIFAVGAAALIWRFRPQFQVDYLSVGQGNCALVQQHTKRFIIDCGSTSNKKACSQILLPALKYYGISYVDGIFISHNDADHQNGLMEWLENYAHSHVQVGCILLPALQPEVLAAEFEQIFSLANELQIPVRTVAAGDELSLGDLSICVYHPAGNWSDISDSNAYSQVLLFQYGDAGFLFPGDIGIEQEMALVQSIKGQKVTCLMASHHGSKFSNSEAFLKACSPEFGVISYGAGNSYGHPHKEAVDRLTDTGAGLFETAKDGAVCFQIRKSRIFAHTFMAK